MGTWIYGWFWFCAHGWASALLFLMVTLDGKLYFEAKKMLTCMITKGNYFLSKCKVKN
jgi:hypothetical protein